MLSETAELHRLRLEREVAIKLYAKARRIPIEDARDNVRDAVDIEIDARTRRGDASGLDANEN